MPSFRPGSAGPALLMVPAAKSGDALWRRLYSMQNMKVLLALGACFGAAVVAACSSSSSGSSSGPTDAGGEDVTITADSGDDGSTTCLPLGGTGCAKGSACCLDTSGGIAALVNGGMCVMPGTCQYSIEVACTA